MDKKRDQVIKQCDAVAHLARSLADVNSDYAQMLREGGLGHLLDIIGERTARHMELLGDILNGMDAVEADGWLDPVFEEAHRMWPQE